MKVALSFIFLLLLSCNLFNKSSEEDLQPKVDNTARINELNLKLNGVNDTLKLCRVTREWRLGRIDTLSTYINDKRTAIYNDSIYMDNYFSEHKAEVACIVAGYVSAKVQTDFGTEYPETVRKASGWGLFFSLAYYFTHKDEVDEVYNESKLANARKQNMYSEIDEFSQSILQERNYLIEIENMEQQANLRSTSLIREIELLQ